MGDEPNIELADFLLIAEGVLAIDAMDLHRVVNVALAESALAAPHASFGGSAFYPDPVEQAAVLCSRIVRNHPLRDGNKRTAYLCMREHLARRGYTFTHASQADTADMIERLAAREISESDLLAWLGERVDRDAD